MKWMKSGFLFIMCSIYQPPNIKPYPPQPPLLMSVFSPTAQNNLLCSLVGWIEQLITQNLTDLFDLFNNVLMLCFSRKLANADQSSYTHTRTCSQTKTLINVIITNHYLRQMPLLSVNAVLHLCFQILDKLRFNFRQVNKCDYIFHRFTAVQFPWQPWVLFT